jgi:hypothetical protein
MSVQDVWTEAAEEFLRARNIPIQPPQPLSPEQEVLLEIKRVIDAYVATRTDKESA